jgi:hypothetical protein
MQTWDYEQNVRRIRIVREYRNLLQRKHLIPKQAAQKICAKFNICRKTIYNYCERLKDMPLKPV